jgi:chemotaxis protein methyltransferase WspC
LTQKVANDGKGTGAISDRYSALLLDANSISSGAIANVIAQRMATCKITHISGYLGLLHKSPQEGEALIDSVIVPETWFFREPESFTLLKYYILSEWLLTKLQRVLRVLSVPSATGEEPYSIAIALLEAGLTAAKVHIDAVDISKQCLVKAQRAIYDQYSFRGNSLSFQGHYFQPTDSGYRLRKVDGYVLLGQDLVRSIAKVFSSGQASQVNHSARQALSKTYKRVLVVDDSITVREMERKLWKTMVTKLRLQLMVWMAGTQSAVVIMTE